jgi:hypothetical protein
MPLPLKGNENMYVLKIGNDSTLTSLQDMEFPLH